MLAQRKQVVTIATLTILKIPLQSFMRNGKPLFTLLMGYIGSQIIGGFYVCLAFDERASKITYLIHAPLWPAVFWFTVGVWPKIQVLLVVGASIALWFSE